MHPLMLNWPSWFTAAKRSANWREVHGTPSRWTNHPLDLFEFVNLSEKKRYPMLPPIPSSDSYLLPMQTFVTSTPCYHIIFSHLQNNHKLGFANHVQTHPHQLMSTTWQIPHAKLQGQWRLRHVLINCLRQLGCVLHYESPIHQWLTQPRTIHKVLTNHRLSTEVVNND